MTVMVTKKQKLYQQIIGILSVVSVFAIVLLSTYSSSYSKGPNNLLAGWVGVRGLPISSIMITLVLALVGKKVAGFVTSLINTIFTIITVVIDIRYSTPQIGLWIDLILAISISVVCLLTIFDKTNDYENSYYLEKRDSIMLSVFTFSIIGAYYFMNMTIQNFWGRLNELGSINFFAAFTVSDGELGILHVAIAVLIMVALFFAWTKKNKIFFCVDMALAVLCLIMVFEHFDMPYRTINFWIVLVLLILETVFAILIFRNHIKPNYTKKIAELEILKQNGVINEEEYLKKKKEYTEQRNG